MIQLKILQCVVLLFLAGCAHQPGKPLQLQASGQLPAIAAEFETVITANDGQPPQYYHWRFWRSARLIETHNLYDNSGEIWSLSADGKMGYEQVFHQQKQVIEYVPGDLNAIGLLLDWSSLATLLNPAMSASLLANGREIVLGRSAVHYQSHHADPLLEILWLEYEQIPALIKRTESSKSITTRITALYPLAQSPWPYQRSGDYHHTDFADLGDKESDPFIQSILYKTKGGLLTQ